MRTVTFVTLCVVFGGCRYLAPPTPQVTPERSGLLSNSGSADPTRQQQLPGRPCVVACGPGLRCNETTAECEPDARPAAADGGLHWLP